MNNTVNAAGGKLLYSTGVAPKVSPKKGVGLLGYLVFTVGPTQQTKPTQITFTKNTIATIPGSNQSQLTYTIPLTINFGQNTTPSPTKKQ